jgi:hypothetical protein
LWIFSANTSPSAAEDGEVLAEDEDLPTVDGPPAGDDAVAVGTVRQGILGAMAGQHVELVERSLVEEVLDPLPGKHLAPLVLTVDRPLGARRDRLLTSLVQVLDPFPHGMFHRARR